MEWKQAARKIAGAISNKATSGAHALDPATPNSRIAKGRHGAGHDEFPMKAFEQSAGVFDGADRAAQFSEPAEPADRGVAGIGALGLREIVEHAMAVIRPEHDLVAG